MVIKKGTSPKKRSVAPKRKTTTSKKIPPKSKNMSQTLAEEVCASPEIKKHKSVTMEVLQKLRLYFSLGFSDEKACYYAKISTSTLYNYQKKFPDFLEEKTMLKESLTDQAKINIAKEIKGGSTGDSWKWLEKKLPEEFGNKVGINHSGNIGSYNFTTNLEEDNAKS